MAKWQHKESEYRYYAAVEADVEPLPKSHRPNPHPLTNKARAEMRKINKDIREIDRLIRRFRIPVGSKPHKKREKLIQRLKELSHEGRRKVPIEG